MLGRLQLNRLLTAHGFDRKVEHLVRSTVRLRRTAIEARVKLINAARGLARTMGYPIPACDADDFTERARQHLRALGGLPVEILKMLEPTTGTYVVY